MNNNPTVVAVRIWGLVKEGKLEGEFHNFLATWSKTLSTNNNNSSAFLLESKARGELEKDLETTLTLKRTNNER